MNNNTAPLLHTTNQIQFKVQGKAMPLLSITDFSILNKDFIVLLGHNGSGKSTLINILSGIQTPTMGQVYIEKQLLSTMPPATKAIQLISLSQNADKRLFVELTVAENITLWESRFPIAQRLNYEQILAFTSRADKFMHCLHSPISTLSGGEKQALLLALVLAHPPRILFLDESTAALDHQAAKEIMQLTAEAITKYNITTVMVTHNLEDAINYGNRLILMSDGKILFDQKKASNLSLQQLKDIFNFTSQTIE